LKKQAYFNFILPVWGENYIEESLIYLIPSLLADSNFSQIKKNDCQFTILTREEDKKLFLKNREFKTLKTITRVKFIYIDEFIHKEAPGTLIHHAYEKAILFEKRPHIYVNFIFLNSDTIHASENLKYLFSLVRKGKRCIVGANLRISAESGIKKNLQQEIVKKGFLKYKASELVDIAIDYMHPFTLSAFWKDSDRINISANKFYWSVKNYGIISRNYLLHPILVRPERQIQSLNGFIDYALIPLAIKNKNNIHTINDSNKYCWIEVESFTHDMAILTEKKYDPYYAAQFLQYWVTQEHVEFSKKSINYYTSKYKEEDKSPDWELEERDADSSIKLLNSYFDRHFYSGIDHPYWRKAKYIFSGKLIGRQNTTNLKLTLRRARLFLSNFIENYCFVNLVLMRGMKNIEQNILTPTLLVGNLTDNVFLFIISKFQNKSIVTLETWPWTYQNALHVSKLGGWSAPYNVNFKSCIFLCKNLSDVFKTSLLSFIKRSNVDTIYFLASSRDVTFFSETLSDKYIISKNRNFRFKYSLFFSNFMKFYSKKINLSRYSFLFFVLISPFFIFFYFFVFFLFYAVDFLLNDGQILFKINKK
jgi:hypothetical protein